jgi:eukaryotic-like serine/threonine-protein kinase
MERLTTALAGRYRIERELGQGGMATVYLAHDLRHDRQVALKVLKPELAAVLGGERFVVEIKTTAALQHPHILPLFDSGTADGFLYYVMPYIQGETLRSKLDRETQLGIEEAVRITREVADALDYAHRHGVIHRDIKPENILLHDGRPMVADFGIALALSAAAGGRMTETGLSLGTPHYMSPEQATAEKELSPRSDIYSLGCVLYEMLSGSPPHVGATAQQIVMKIVMEPAQPVTQLRRSVPPNVASAVSRALEKLPADRFETAKAFSEALGNPGYALAATTGYQAVGGSRGSPWSRIFWPAALLLALALGAWGWLRPKPVAPVRWLSLALPDSQSLGSGLAFRLALSPDGERVAYVGAGEGAAAVSKIWLRRLGALAATALPASDEGYNPSFSPDGRRLAFISGNPRTVRVLSLAGGSAISLTDSLVDRGGLAWGYDGYIYYDGHLQGDGIARVRENGGAPEIVSRADSARGEFYHNGPAPLPNGRGVLMAIVRNATNPEATEIGVVDLRTGQHKSLTRGVAGLYSPTGHLLYVTADGTLMAAPFDQDRLELTGEGVALAGGVSVRGVSRVDLALGGGNLLYSSGRGELGARELVWTARNGAATPIDPAWTANMGNPRLSPDGRRVTVSIAVRSDVNVWVKQLDQGPVLKLSPNGGVTSSWSPDGRSILYINPSTGILRVPADGSALPATLKPAGYGRLQSAAVSPDGQWLVYGQGLNLYMARTSGDTVRHEITATQAVEVSPTISPDGRWVAYSSDESGRFEVYVRPFPETSTTRWLVSNRGGGLPRWSRDGKELFFIDSNGDLLAVPVNPGPVFSFGVPAILFATEPFGAGNISIGYDVHPDGKRFVMLRSVGNAVRRDEMILVENLSGELRARVTP